MVSGSLRLFPALLLAVAVSTATAQGGPPPGGGPGGGMQMRQRGMEMLLKGITLSTEQKAKLDSLQETHRAERMAFTPGPPADSSEMAARRTMMRRHNEEIRALLTPEQQKIYDRNLEDMRARMQNRRGRPRQP
jgi:Spy/CpxP family protein refolding chaperone